MNDYSLKACPKVEDIFNAINDDLNKIAVNKEFDGDDGVIGVVKSVTVRCFNEERQYTHRFEPYFIVAFNDKEKELPLSKAVYKGKLYSLVKPFMDAFNEGWKERLEALKEKGFEIRNDIQLDKYTGNEVDLQIPEEIIYIDGYCTFKKPLRSLRTHKNFKRIDEGLFYGQKELEYVDLGDVKEIPESVFADCYNLKEIKSINKLKIKQYCFFHCFSLTKVNCEMENINQAFGDTDTFDYALISKKEATYRKHVPDLSNITNHETFYKNLSKFLQSRAVMEFSGIYWLGELKLVTGVEEYHTGETPKILLEMDNNYVATDELEEQFGFICDEANFFCVDDVAKFQEAIHEYAEKERKNGADDNKHHFFTLNSFIDIENHLDFYNKSLDFQIQLDELCGYFFASSNKKLEENDLKTILESMDFIKEYADKFLPQYVDEYQKLGVLINKLLNKEELTRLEEMEFFHGFNILKDEMLFDVQYRVENAVVALIEVKHGANLLHNNNSHFGITFYFRSYLFYFGVDGDIRYATVIEEDDQSDRRFEYPYFEVIGANILYRTDRKEYKKAIWHNEIELHVADVIKHKARRKKDAYHYVWYSCGLEDIKYDFKEYVSLTDMANEDKDINDVVIDQIILLDIENTINEKDYATFMFYYNIAKNMKDEDWYRPGAFYFDETIMYEPKFELIPVEKEKNFKKITSVYNQPID